MKRNDQTINTREAIEITTVQAHARSQNFLRGGAFQGGADQTRQEEHVCRGELGCLRLYYESFEKHEYCGTSKLIFLAKRQLYHYLLEGACA